MNAAANYYFMVVSTFVIAAAGTWVTERIVVPRLGEYTGEERSTDVDVLSAEERRGLRFAAAALVVFAAVLLWGTVPAGGFLRDPQTGGLLDSPFLSGIVAFIFLGGTWIGIAYGVGAGRFKSDTDVMNGMGKTIGTLGTYLVLVFFAAQFVEYFNWTNLGLILAIKGAETLRASGLGDVTLMLSFVLLSSALNLLMGSASAKWAVMAPVFVPMFMLLGYTPRADAGGLPHRRQHLERHRPDDVLLRAHRRLLRALRQDVRHRHGGSRTMLPYTVVFLACWSVMLVIWMLLGVPVGPGAGLYLEAAG